MNALDSLGPNKDESKPLSQLSDSAKTSPPDSPSQPSSDLLNAKTHEEALKALDEHDAKLGINPADAEVGERRLADRLKTVLIGKPRDLTDHSVFHSLSLVAFLAWVGLGADGLSSSCYGPSEAFGALEGHTYLAVFLALATSVTVFVISACYSHIIEEFPSGGGGYLVASKLLRKEVGVVSGCALLVDYTLTITTSIAAAGNALFGLAGLEGAYFGLAPEELKLWTEAGVIILLVVLNLRGVKESVMILMPIFLVFLLTHAVLIFGSIFLHANQLGAVATEVTDQVRAGLSSPTLGLLGMLSIFLRAYSLGAGTYTGIEAVSNSMPLMREPRVATGKRTMRYMAISLSITAGGLMLAYLLLRVPAVESEAAKTMNHLLSERFVDSLAAYGLPSSWGEIFVWITVISEGCLLFVAAQAGFIDGPRVLANMARDSWMPHWFGNLSERLATHNGVLLMGASGLAALLFTRGQVSALLVMYSINVFVTFSLSLIGMCRHWYLERESNPIWRRRLALFAFGTLMCLSILGVTVYEKFSEGGYVTIVVTSTLVAICLLIHQYYERVRRKLGKLDSLIEGVTAPDGEPLAVEPDAKAPTAAVLVGGYSGLGVHTMLNALRFVPGHFENMVFLSVGVVDSGNFKGADAVEQLTQHTEGSVNKYVDHARRLGMPAIGYIGIGTDPVEELERLCVEVKKRFPHAIFFAGQLVFQRDAWYQRLLHNETAYALQRRLQWDGVSMVILPTRVR